MNYRATASFWKAYGALPETTRARADKAFEILKRDPRHPSLHLKKIGDLWSARISLDCRALALEDSSDLVWIWIGSHADYDRLLR